MADPLHIPRYPALVKPEFKSTIPPHLVDKLSPHERYLVESTSRMEAQNGWIIDAIIAGNRTNLETDLRVQDLQDWKTMVCSKWSIAAAFLMLSFPVLVKAILDKVWKP